MAGRKSHASELLEALSGPAEPYLRMAAAAAEDVADPVRRHAGSDPFDFRDPRHIEQTLPALRLASHLYFSADGRGLENIPSEGPVLLVGSHSGGTLIADTFVFSQAFYDHFGARNGASISSPMASSSRCGA